MPSAKEHLWQANHNEECYDLLITSEFLDWAVSCIFYSALHYIDAYLANQDYHPQTHDKRTSLVARERVLKKIYREYRWLKDESEGARYRVKRFKQNEVEDLKNEPFERIKGYILNFFPS